MPRALTAFVDTKVLLYAQDPRDPGKRVAASAWLPRCWTNCAGRTSTQVLNEFYVNLRKAAPTMTPLSAREVVRRRSNKVAPCC